MTRCVLLYRGSALFAGGVGGSGGAGDAETLEMPEAPEVVRCLLLCMLESVCDGRSLRFRNFRCAVAVFSLQSAAGTGDYSASASDSLIVTNVHYQISRLYNTE